MPWTAARRATLVLGGILLVVVGGALLLLWQRGRDLRFDPQVWLRHAAEGDRDNPRYRMRAHVLERLVPGMPKDTVRSLLGPPNQEVLGAHPGGAVMEWYYCLGMHSGFGVDEDVLHVAFGEDGAVVSAYVVQH